MPVNLSLAKPGDNYLDRTGKILTFVYKRDRPHFPYALKDTKLGCWRSYTSTGHFWSEDHPDPKDLQCKVRPKNPSLLASYLETITCQLPPNT